MFSIAHVVYVFFRSKFVAFCGHAKTHEDALRFVKALKQRVRKVNVATHNIMAYQLKGGDAFRDDDGEGGAGDRLLQLLGNLRIYNVVVVVTRWYGGIQLGPDRFKHISNCAKDILTEHRDKFD